MRKIICPIDFNTKAKAKTYVWGINFTSISVSTVFSADFWEGDATKHFSVKKGVFSEKGGGNSVNQGFGKDFYRKGNSVKRFGPFHSLNPRTLKTEKLLSSSPSPKSAPRYTRQSGSQSWCKY